MYLHLYLWLPEVKVLVLAKVSAELNQSVRLHPKVIGHFSESIPIVHTNHAETRTDLHGRNADKWGGDCRSPFHTYRLVLFLRPKYFQQHSEESPSCARACVCVFICVCRYIWGQKPKLDRYGGWNMEQTGRERDALVLWRVDERESKGLCK